MSRKYDFIDLVDSDTDNEGVNVTKDEEYILSSPGDSSGGSDSSDDSNYKEKHDETAMESTSNASTRKQNRNMPRRKTKLSNLKSSIADDIGDGNEDSIDDDIFVSLQDRLEGRTNKNKRSERENGSSNSSTINPTRKRQKTALKSVENTMPTLSSSSSTSASTACSKKAPRKKVASTSFDTTDSGSNKVAEAAKYIELLQDRLKKRKFPLSQVPEHEIINTGRTIKSMKAWKGHWPALREFLQNTIDHLQLMSGTTGRRQNCLKMNVETKNEQNDEDHLAIISFTCQTEIICKIIVSSNEVIIDQSYTYPIASRALDTGVPDSTKSTSNSQAGGFGDGFKTASVALIANAKKNDFHSLQWKFYAVKEKIKIEWDFVGLTRDKVATFSKCQVLQVQINKKDMDSSDMFEVMGRDVCVSEKGREYVMRQSIKVKGIGKSFLYEAIPRFVVFWNLNEESLISMSRTSRRACGGDFLGSISSQPIIFNGEISNSIKPCSGVYVKGIYVRGTKIKDTIMSFFGDRLDVSGRDRNEVDEDELVDAVATLLGRCSNLPYLCELLSPLKGDTKCSMDYASTNSSKKGQSTRGKSSSSWLLQSPRFFNRVIEIQKDFILYNVFQIPRGAIYVSKKTTDSKDSFINWAASYLKKNGAPLVPIAKVSAKLMLLKVFSHFLHLHFFTYIRI